MLLSYSIFIAKMVFTRQNKNEIIALLADQLNDFKNRVIEEIKSFFLSYWKKILKKLWKKSWRKWRN